MAFVNSTKTPSDSSLLERTSRRFLWCCSSFMSVFFMLVAVHFRATFSMPPAIWALPLVLFIALLFRLQRALRVWMGAFFTLRSFPTFLSQPAFTKASLGAGSCSLKFAGLHVDHRNVDPTHLFVWFTAFHNLDTQENLSLNRTKYYHELLVVKSLVYLLLTRFKFFLLVQSHM